MSKPRPALKEARRADAAAWVHAGLDLLAESGVDAVRVEVLARRLNITKGSFYWHFKDRADLLTAMLDNWRRQATMNIIERLERSGQPPRARLRRLIELPQLGERSAHGASIEMAIRLWAKKDEPARLAVAEIDAQRLAYISGLVGAVGAENAADGEARAFLYYAYILAEAFLQKKLSPAGEAACDAILGKG